ncbi:NAD(P)/FAD-dependent oxidoreductase [Cohnella sp. GCM10020058]|uniref:NAD(P)/FAD-dependent oxidoreductase n=1 Tax=Cohnella sp. GCM10020058 TaxID=3317330 RepID=UPI0036411737
MTDRLETFDLTIVGGGPAGLYAAFYGGLRDMRVKLIEARAELGGRLLTYADKVVWDVGGVPPIRCGRLIEQMIRQARTFEPAIVLGQRIAQLERSDDGTMIVVSDTGERHRTRSLILALGHGVPGPVRLELDDTARYEAANLHYAQNLNLDLLRGKRVLLSRGGGSSAAVMLDELAAVAAKVIVVRRSEGEGGDKRLKRFGAGTASLELRVPYAIEQLHGDGASIESVTIRRIGDDIGIGPERERLDVDAVIVDHGTRSEYGPIAAWGLQRSAWNFDADASLATGLPGIYLAGDAAHFPSKLHLIAGAISDAALAVNSAKRYLDPTASKSAPMSTSSAKLAERLGALNPIL